MFGLTSFINQRLYLEGYIILWFCVGFEQLRIVLKVTLCKGQRLGQWPHWRIGVHLWREILLVSQWKWRLVWWKRVEKDQLGMLARLVMWKGTLSRRGSLTVGSRGRCLRSQRYFRSYLSHAEKHSKALALFLQHMMFRNSATFLVCCCFFFFSCLWILSLKSTCFDKNILVFS